MTDPRDGPDAHLFAHGQDGILVRFGDGYVAWPDRARGFAQTVRAADLTAVREVASSLASTLVRFDPTRTTRREIETTLRHLLSGGHEPDRTAGRHWSIPACFGGEDGPQLNDVAGLAGVSPEAAVAEITGTDLSVLAIGFAPGQPYLGHLADRYDLPRQTDLTPRVPQGALVVALRQIVLFANPSPTGWRQIGRCAFRPFQPDRAEPFALRAGDRVRFVSTQADEMARLATSDDGLGGATCEVLT